LAHGGSSAQLGFSGMILFAGDRFGGFLRRVEFRDVSERRSVPPAAGSESKVSSFASVDGDARDLNLVVFGTTHHRNRLMERWQHRSVNHDRWRIATLPPRFLFGSVSADLVGR